ncbi:MAG TPA: hypothetical protein PKW95_04660 [bacterium]|nr:hypothetical protein [bacterium]
MEAKQINYIPLLISILILLLLGGASLAPADVVLPACGDFIEPELWFEIDDFGSAIATFEDEYNPHELAECTTTVIGNAALVYCGEWEFSLTWLRDQQPIPIVNEQTVKAWATIYDYDAGRGHLFLLDENENIILMHTNMGIPDGEGTPVVIEGETDLFSPRVCAYTPSHLQPGYQNPDIQWDYCYGRSFWGVFDGSSFDEIRPADWTTTDDGRYDIFNAIDYTGQDQYDAYSVTRIQIVPGSDLPHDDDDSVDDDQVDDDAADDDDNATPDADDDDDNNDGCGCN